MAFEFVNQTVVSSFNSLSHLKDIRIYDFIRWPTTVTAKELTSWQKEKPHGKKENLTAKRKTSRQKEKPHGKKKNLTAKRKRFTAKRKTSRQKEKDSRQKEKD